MDCLIKEGQLLLQSAGLDVLAGSTAETTIEVPTGRGMVKGVALFTKDATSSDLDKCTVEILINSVGVILPTPLKVFSPVYQKPKRFWNVVWPEKSIVTVRLKNTAANTLGVFVALYFAPSENA